MKKLNSWFLLVVGLFFIAFGVGFTVQADVGVFPTTCLPVVISNIMGITVGKAVILFQGALIIGQMLILGKDYKMVQLLQIIVGISFGYITDFAMFVLRGMNFSGYVIRLIIFFIGVVISAIGVSIEVIAGIATLATEGFVIAACKVSSIEFGTMKLIFDVSLVVLSLVVSLLFLRRVEGIREGTVLSAVLVGLFSKYIIRIYYNRGGHNP